MRVSIDDVEPCQFINFELFLLSQSREIMGKESQLLEAAAAGNNSKVEQLLRGRSRLKRFLSNEKLVNDDADEGPPLLITEKRVTSLDLEYRDENGSSALHLAALNGHRDVAYTLLQYSASINAKDLQGNTALHFAAWHNRSDIVELLLVNGAKADSINQAGSTPLHFACQYCPPGKTFTIVKLLQHKAGILIINKEGDSAFDLAVRFNRKEAVALLVDAEPKLLRNIKTVLEAAKKGRSEIMETLLDAGMDPNCSEVETGTSPLVEAVRFFRKDVAKVLLEFGAQPHLRSSYGQSAIDVAKQHPDAKREEFMRLFDQHRGRRTRIAQAVKEKQSPAHVTETTAIVYPLLKNKEEWTYPSAEFCSAWTKQHPNTCLLDNDSTTYWKIPAAGAYNWVAFDLGSEYTITGVRISGWDDKQMVHQFFVETAPALSGPWKQVQKYKADSIGSEDMNDPSETQDFRGFYETSRYWRLTVADNYGGPTTCLAEVQFFGVENGVVDWFERLDLQQYLKGFVQRGFNQLSELALMTKRDFEGIVMDVDHVRRLEQGAKLLREKHCPPKNMKWAVQPPVKTTCDKVLPEISVFSESYTTGKVEIVALPNGKINGKTVVSLVSKDNGYLSKAAFKGLSISPAGEYILEVRSVANPRVVLRSSEPIKVAPAPMKQAEIGKLFDDLDDMLKFDI